ncbi:MAG: CBS domain-containing protein [Polyangiaceae bacterium]|nr:CBS domain-containing protein [Polyangiaceae bacterium]MCW5790796.1 CBS domain-containing protein [Polyangiaceae bacterium]
MEVILTHELTDFDAFASAVAAQKLYPGAEIVFGRRVAPALRDYLALHRDRFRTLRYTDIDQRAVTRVILVDHRRKSRLGVFGGILQRLEAGDETLDVHLFDHHPAVGPDDVVGSYELVEAVGSATTLLVERIKALGLAVDVEEATLFALGIYADTGSLTYASTSGRDARAVGWLLDQGGRLKTVNRYLRPAFTASQRELIKRVLTAVETHDFAGAAVGIACVKLDKMVGGLAEITTAVAGFDDHLALFVFYDIGDKQVQVVARGTSPVVNVGERLAPLGGGGHAGAAAANVKGACAAELIDRLVRGFKAEPPKPRRVDDVMSRLVRTIAPDTPLVELSHSLRVWRHTGVPVVRDGGVVGIVSRRDVERAEADGRMHLPVSSCMSRPVHTTRPDASLEDALREMERHNVGRLPVLDGARLVGILTRSDVRGVLYGPSPERDALSTSA